MPGRDVFVFFFFQHLQVMAELKPLLTGKADMVAVGNSIKLKLGGK